MLYACRVVRVALLGALLVAVAHRPAAAQGTEPPRIAGINLAYVAQSSQAGKAALARIEARIREKETAIAARAAALRQEQAALQQPDPSLDARTRAERVRAFERARLDFERLQQDARAELQGLQAEFDTGFAAKLQPVVEAVARERGLHFVFSLDQAPMVAWWSGAQDISAEIIKRLDAHP